MSMADPVHLTDPVSPQRTLCKQSVFGVNVRDMADERPDNSAGCWSCLMAAKKIDAVIGSTSWLRSDEARRRSDEFLAKPVRRFPAEEG